ncbi:MAG TPA: efflux transporter outer membrane subunit [Burkholderiaceae bacterium]|nr:efflux transporter outer membrane subunit [Burkholderiaceae bacterium]
MKLSSTVPALAVLLLLAGCAIPEPVTPPSPVAAAAAFRESEGRWAAVQPAEGQPRGQWWRVFGDPVVDDLVGRAESASNSLAIAAARVRQARALLGASEAQRLPQVGIDAGASRWPLPPAFMTRPGQASPLFSAGVGASYEPDLFGRIARAIDAASLDVAAQQALQNSTRLLLQADVVQTYFALRAVDAERALVRQTVEAHRDTLRLTERRQAAGDVAELDVVRVRAEASATEAQAIALDRRRAELEHALAVLVGESASRFTLAEADWAAAPPRIPAGVPGSVLARRPDVAAAQQAMIAAQARVGVARTAWFPAVSLTASGGYASTDIGDLFKWSARAWGVGALLSLPVFDGGRRAASVVSAQAQWDAAAAGYREQVLQAVRDVEDQLSALRTLAEQAEVQAQAVDSASRATVLSNARYRAGYVSQLELLDARRSELANRRQALQVRAGQYGATVALVRALGGDWSEPVSAVAARMEPASADFRH